MNDDAKRALGSIAAVAAACAVAFPFIAAHEGLVQRPYADPIGIRTVCWGHTGSDIESRAYTADQCAAILMQDATRHGLDIAPCLPAELPVKTRAAFISFAFNVGAKAFCSSTLARKAVAGDLVGACNELPRWVMAGGKKLPGLVKRRTEERGLCLEGVNGVQSATA